MPAFTATPEMITPPKAIEPGWVDYNGHLNQAYYGVIFDQSIDTALWPVGLGPDYIQRSNCSFMTVESHTCFVRELLATDTVVVATRVVDVDEKRLHTFSEMRHAVDGWLAATCEFMFLHIDMRVRRTSPWPAEMRERLEALAAAARTLPETDRVGRRIGIRRQR